MYLGTQPGQEERLYEIVRTSNICDKLKEKSWSDVSQEGNGISPAMAMFKIHLKGARSLELCICLSRMEYMIILTSNNP